MRELAQTRVRVGYRRLRVLMQREGWQVGRERFYRVYTEEGLALRRKRPWRHVTAVHREQRRAATARNDIWRMDFVADQLADGRRFRALTVIDMCTRECLAIDIGHGFGGHDVAATRERLRFERGVPQRIHCDNGTEFVSAAMDLWAYTNGVILDFSRRGKPTDNAMIESFNARLRLDCLNVHWFTTLEDAQQKIDAFRWDYNEHHPHRALKGQSPREFAQRMLATAAGSL
jgi:putative transposase